MIFGEFGSKGELYFEIEIITADGEDFPLQVMLDTGFTDGWLSMDIQDIDSLGWSLVEPGRVMTTARGDEAFDIYEGTVRVDGQEFTIPVVATIAIPENLVGLQWLKTRRLVVDFPVGVLTLRESSL